MDDLIIQQNEPAVAQAVCLNCGTVIEDGEVFCERCRGKLHRTNILRVYTEDDDEFFRVEPAPPFLELVKRHIAQYRVPFLLSSVAVVIIVAILTIQGLAPLAEYNRAERLFNAGQYLEAANAFRSIGAYRDAPERVSAAALKLADTGEFRDALTLLPESEHSALIERWIAALQLEGRYTESCEIAAEFAPEALETVATNAITALNASDRYGDALNLSEIFLTNVNDAHNTQDFTTNDIESFEDYEIKVTEQMIVGNYQDAYDLLAEQDLPDATQRLRTLEVESIAAYCASIYRTVLLDPQSFRLRGVWFEVSGDADAEITGVVLQIDGLGANGQNASHYCIFTPNSDTASFEFVWAISDSFASTSKLKGSDAELNALQKLLRDAAKLNVTALLNVNPPPPENAMVSISRIQQLAESGNLSMVRPVCKTEIVTTSND